MRHAHLVGRVNLSDTETVMRTVSELGGESIIRMPDGERGERSKWIAAQIPLFAAQPALEPGEPRDTQYGPRPTWRLRPEASPDDLHIEFPYVSAARESYELFAQLKEQGVIASDVRFQAAMPTPIASAATFFEDGCQRVVAPAIERLLVAQAHEIAELVPYHELAQQWDVAVEFLLLEEGGGAAGFSLEEIVSQLGRLADAAPEGVQVGFHLCYGDSPPEPGAKGRHFREPDDTRLLVEVANGTIDRASRRVDFIHLPVPIDRDDDAYFAPLRALRLPQAADLFLGLVHEEDGLEGARRRIAAAYSAVDHFGIATECGMGNVSPQEVLQLLSLQRQLSAELR
jgi:hypothetical protein